MEEGAKGGMRPATVEAIRDKGGMGRAVKPQVSWADQRATALALPLKPLPQAQLAATRQRAP